MKKIILLSTAALMLLATACKKDNGNGNGNGNGTPCAQGSTGDLIQFAFPTIDQDAQMDPTAASLFPLAPVGQWVDLPAIPFATNQDSILNSYCGATRSNVQKIETTQLKVEVLMPATQTLGFIDSIEIHLDSVGGTNPTLVGYKYGWPASATELSLTIVPNNDIKDYFNADNLEVLVSGTKRDNTQTLDPATLLKFTANFDAEIILP